LNQGSCQNPKSAKKFFNQKTNREMNHLSRSCAQWASCESRECKSGRRNFVES